MVLVVVPVELRIPVLRLLALEGAATTPEQRTAARRETNRLIRRAIDGGWRPFQLAQAVGLTHAQLSHRLRMGRSDQRPAGTRAPSAVSTATWLYPRDAAHIASVNASTLVIWCQAGLLPHVSTDSAGRTLYHRDDVLAVLQLRGRKRILPPGSVRPVTSQRENGSATPTSSMYGHSGGPASPSHALHASTRSRPPPSTQFSTG